MEAGKYHGVFVPRVGRGREDRYIPGMVRWLLAVFVVLLLVNSLTPWLQRLGLGRLPGDLRFRLFGRDVFVPLASTVLVSVLVSLLVKWLGA